MENSMDAKTPQQLEAEGASAYQAGNFIEAAKLFSAAEQGYLVQGDPIKSAEMANNRSVALLQAKKPDDALLAVRDTIEIFREGPDEKRLAMSLGNRAAALEALGELDQASIDYEEAAAIFKRIGEHELRLDVMKSLSALQLRTGRSLEAVATMQAGVNGVEKPTLKHRLLKKILGFPSRFMRK